MPTLLQQNTPGDRKDIRDMLNALPPLERVRFLCECAVAVGKRVNAKFMPLLAARRDDAASDELTARVYGDIVYMAAQYGLPLEPAVTRLAGYVSRPAALRENPSLKGPLADALRGWREAGPR